MRGWLLLAWFRFGSEHKPLREQVPVRVTRNEATFPVSVRSTLGSTTSLRHFNPPSPGASATAGSHPSARSNLRLEASLGGRGELLSPGGRRQGCCPLPPSPTCVFSTKHGVENCCQRLLLLNTEAAAASALPLPSCTDVKGCGKCVAAGTTPRPGAEQRGTCL